MTDLYDDLTTLHLENGCFKYAFKRVPSATKEITFPDLSTLSFIRFDLSKRKDRKRLLESCTAKEVGKTEDGFYVVGENGYVTHHRNKDTFGWIIEWKGIKKIYKKGIFIFTEKEQDND